MNKRKIEKWLKENTLSSNSYKINNDLSIDIIGSIVINKDVSDSQVWLRKDL